MLYEKKPIDNQQAIKALLTALEGSESPNLMDAYEVVELIKALQNDPRTNPNDLFTVEWGYLPILDEHLDASPKLLSRRLAEDPKFFCEIIRLAFQPKKEEPPAEEVSEGRKKISGNAYRLLNEWRTPPGLGEDGAFDGNIFKLWLDLVQKECIETGHIETALLMVGQALTHVTADPDGLWIHRSAAEILNAKDAEVLREGFQAKLFNSRGAHWMDPMGRPEKELAAKYRLQADTVENAGYHRLAVTLRSLAEFYEREAESISSRDPFE